jgi:RNA polymerase sigma-70 factor (ECF subfamily)
MKNTALEFQKIYDAFQPKILRYLARMVGPDESEDLTQDVFLKVLQALPGFRGQSRLSTWLYRIATNAALDRLRRPAFQRTGPVASHDPAGEGGTGVDEEDTAMTEETPSAEQKLIREEMRDCIMEFVEKLPGNYRTVIVLSELEGLRNSEIAEILGVTLDTVKIRLHRARARLKEELKGRCDFYRDERNEIACDRKREGPKPATTD